MNSNDISQTPSAPSPAAGEQSPEEKLHQMLVALWERSKQTIASRVQILEEATALWAGNRLDETSRLRAVDSAHKLAGVLGTFGLPRGTELAREVEEIFEEPAAGGLKRLRALLDEMTGLIEKKTLGPDR